MLALLLFTVGGVQAQSGNWSDVANRDALWGSDYDTATEFIITTPEQFAQFAFMVNNGSNFSGKTVTLDNGVEEIIWDGQVYPQTVWYDGDLSDHYWTPIGTADYPFNGTFNGNGKSITYVKINDNTASYQGFFGNIGNSGKVQNLVFDYGSEISGSTQVGCLAGYNGGTVENCLVLNATVSGTGYVGSIIGQNEGTATDCYCIDCGTTFALGEEGSTTGVDSDGHAQCLYNIEGDESTISDTDFTTSVGSETGVEVGSGTFYSDGIQYNYYHYYKTGAKPTITYNKPGYNVTFSVSGNGANIDGNTNTITVGTGKVTVSLVSKTAASWSGSGTESDPYIIYNREQLDVLAQRVNSGSQYSGKFFKLNDNLRYSDNKVDYEYHVIGTSAKPFCGVFDGNGNTIFYASSIKKNDTYEESLQGLFGYIGEGGVVKNLGATYCSFRGTNFIGVIAGDNAGTIENCRVDYYSSGNVVFTDNLSYYGTIAGNNSGTIRNCVSAGSVKADNNNVSGSKVGGIVGHNTGTVENCLYVGSQLEGTAYVGAIVGYNEGTLTNNYYHDNGYLTNSNIGTTVLGVGASGGLMGTDDLDAAKAKVVILPEGETFAEPYGAIINDTPTYVTTSNPNTIPLSVYANGLLFDDVFIGEKKGNAFYTTATTIELTATNIPAGYAPTFSTTSNGASFSGNTLFVGTDVTKVSVSIQRVATGWLADGVRATSFETTGENSITITSAEELGLLAYNVNFGGQTYEGYTITIGNANGIDLAGNTWEPIGYGLSGGMGGGMAMGGGESASGFLGTFDGAAKPIFNMNVTYDGYVGLFSDVPSGATVKNVRLSSPLVKGANYVGAIAGSVSGTVENCHVTYGSVEFVKTSGSGAGMSAYPGGSRQTGIGGIAGMLYGGSIRGCTVVTTNIYPVVDNAMFVGGIVGDVSESRVRDNINYTWTYVPATLQDCLFAGNIFKKEENSGIGAIAGTSQGTNTITNNYYVDGGTPLPGVTLNTTLLGIDGADVDGARLAIEYDTKPSNIGEAGTQYDWSGVRPYANGLYYNQKYYLSSTAPESMNITLSSDGDNSTLLTTYSGMTGKVTLDRTFVKDGYWYTICLPFTINDINAEGCPLAGAELWQMTDYAEEGNPTGLDEEGTLTLNFENCYDDSNDETTISAGYSYLIRWSNTNETIKDLIFDDVTITATSPKPETFGNNDEITFIGTFAKKTFETEDRSILFLGAENTLYWPQPSGKSIPNIGAFRAYFKLNGITAGDPVAPQSGNIRAFVLNFGDEATGISDMVNNKKASTSEWYSLDGRKLNSVGAGSVPTRFHKGIYINNGRKVVIK